MFCINPEVQPSSLTCSMFLSNRKKGFPWLRRPNCVSAELRLCSSLSVPLRSSRRLDGFLQAVSLKQTYLWILAVSFAQEDRIKKISDLCNIISTSFAISGCYLEFQAKLYIFSNELKYFLSSDTAPTHTAIISFILWKPRFK